MNPTIQTPNLYLLAAAGVVALLWLAVKFWPTISGWFKRTPPVTADLYPHVAALKPALRDDLYNQVLVAVCGHEIKAYVPLAKSYAPLAGEVNPNG